MASSSSSTAELAKLLRQTHLASHEELLRAANAALKASKTDTRARHVKVVALLKLDRYEDAVRAFDEPSAEELKEAAKLEYAYALYKTGRLEQAGKVADGQDKGDIGRALKHVAAQTNYKLENFEKATSLYQELEGDDPQAVNEANDLRINRSAIDGQLEWKGLGHLARSRKTQKDDFEGFERAFNAACACIARGELRQAEVLLNRSKQLCSADDDLSDADKKVELLPILVQLVYVLAQQGKHEEARSVCDSLPLEKNSDSWTKYIALNNIVAVRPSENPFVTQRIFQSVPPPTGGDAPFDYQTVTLTQNSYTVDLLSQKWPGVAKATAAKLKSAPSPTTDPKIVTLAVLNAAANTTNETHKQAVKTMLPLLEKRPTDVGLLLTIVQLYILTNHPTAAIQLLEAFFKRLEQSSDTISKSVQFSPGLVGLAVELYSSQGMSSTAKTLLIDAANYWKSNSTKRSPLSPLLLRTAGSLLVLDPNATKRDAEVATSIFEELRSANPKDAIAMTGLVAAKCIAEGFSVKLDDSLLDPLPPVEKLIGKIDATALEEAGVYAPPAAQHTSTKKKRAAPGEETAKPQEQKKKRKLSAKRMPEDYVEGKAVDPERWMPLRDRSYWKPKGKKGKARAAGLTQGGVVDEGRASPAPVAASGGVVSGKSKKKRVKGKK